jgi:hypothetical protein
MPLTTDVVCSARGCRAAATWALRWNNPRLHTPERRKTWVACDQHRGSLAEYLESRGLLRETLPAHQLPRNDESPPTDQSPPTDEPPPTDRPPVVRP